MRSGLPRSGYAEVPLGTQAGILISYGLPKVALVKEIGIAVVGNLPRRITAFGTSMSYGD